MHTDSAHTQIHSWVRMPAFPVPADFFIISGGLLSWHKKAEKPHMPPNTELTVGYGLIVTSQKLHLSCLVL